MNIALAAVDPAVIPLYALIDRTQLSTIGSAVLLRATTGQHLVVTAGHVIDSAAGRGLFTMGNDATGLLRLHGDGIISVAPDGRRDLDKIDLAAMLIDRQTAAVLEDAEAIFLSAGLLADDEGSPSPYAFAGFPLSINKFRHERQPDGGSALVLPHTRVVIYARAASAAAYKRTRADPRFNLVASFKHKDARLYQTSKAGFPHPRGMSGGAVFRIRDTGANYRSGLIDLVGVGIEYHQKPGVLVAANARAIRELLASV